MTAQDQQSRAAYEDGKWYWVEREGWHGEPPTIAPACYKANCDAWYSHIFSGISTPYLKVLEPCERQAARALPADLKPVAEIYAGDLFRVSQGPDAEPVTGDHDLYTAAQVLAMGRVPPEWQAVPVDLPDVMVDAFENSMEAATTYVRNFRAAYSDMLAAAPRPPAAQVDIVIPTSKENQQVAAQVDCIGLALELESQAKRVESQSVERAMAAAAHGLQLLALDATSQALPAMYGAQALTTGAGSATAGPVQERKPLTPEQIHKWWASENGLEDSDMGRLIDFTTVVREVESKLGIK